MKCYNLYCEERSKCFKYKMAVCLFRLSKNQIKLIESIGERCIFCGNKKIYGRRSKSRVRISICTKCGTIQELKDKGGDVA